MCGNVFMKFNLQNVEFGSELKHVYSNMIFWIKAEWII